MPRRLSRFLAVTAALLVLPPLLIWLARAPLMEHIDRRYAQAVAEAPRLDTGCGKVWAHRALAGGAPENSLAGVRAAFALGAGGVEIDILYDRDTQRFLVSHDRPYTRFDGQPLALDDLLAQTAALGHFWLDAKDLEELAPWHARKAVAELVRLIEAHGLRERAFVESAHPVYLAWLAEAGVHTVFLSSPNERRHPAVFLANAYLVKWAYTLGPFSALSLNPKRYTPRVRALIGDEVPVLLSTVNDRERLAALAAGEQVRVVLTDEPAWDIARCAAPAAALSR